jgi:DNA-directed RNA polymerase subunit RPC12/RpoP
MKSVECKQCGSKELIEDNGYATCVYCQSRFVVEIDEPTRKRVVIDVQSDIETLLKKCIEEPTNRRRYASLVLDIDPSNTEAIKYLTGGK